jgi:hypothetical protein
MQADSFEGLVELGAEADIYGIPVPDVSRNTCRSRLGTHEI